MQIELIPAKCCTKCKVWLPATIEYWFKSKCVVCSSTKKLELDHWIPISNINCPGTIATNVVLLCKSCNSSKSNKLPMKWLIWKFKNEYLALHIFIKVFNYFKSININN